jgi:Xaa-Pro aminopeptidase
MQARIDKLRQVMDSQAIDGFLVTSTANLRYLTNFTGTAGLALIMPEEAFFITDFRYTEQAKLQAVGYTIIKSNNFFDTVADLVIEKGVKRLAFEETKISYYQYEILDEIIEAELEPVTGMIEALREIKDADEIAKIEQAIQITDAAYSNILETIQPGMTEIQVANHLDFYMRSLGASGVSFDTIVASGLRSALPHGVASQKVIEKGEIVTLDFGCFYEGYVSDMTRTFSIGDPGNQLKEIYDIVLNAQLKVIAALKPGMTGEQMDAVARDFITEHGYGEAFGHSIGHSIGLEIHETPFASIGNETPFVENNIITDEPGIYVPGVGGVRIEDDLLVTATGNRVLNASPKRLIIL